MDARKQRRTRKRYTTKSRLDSMAVTDENCTLSSVDCTKRRKSSRLAKKTVMKERNSTADSHGSMRTNREVFSPTNCLQQITPGEESYQRTTPMQTTRRALLEPRTSTSTPVRGSWPTQNFSEYTPEQNNGLLTKKLHLQIKSPLPDLTWADSDQLWDLLKSKDYLKLESESLLKLRHPCITPNMRSILLDWMQEVSEVYRLHRETYYLALDLYDRYMESQIDISKDVLQRIGVTCLFAAAKIEEIYPPKVKEFAYVTDGACMVSDILEEELKIYKALKWKLSRCYTVNNWVNTLMQLGDNVSRSKGAPLQMEYPAGFVLPQYSPLDFVKVMSLLDLCTMDISNRMFSPSILAATSMFLVLDSCQQYFTIITGIELKDISSCVHWMKPFCYALQCRNNVVLKQFHGPPEVMDKDCHNIQTHEVNLQMLDNAQKYRRQMEQVISHQHLSGVTPPIHGRQYLSPMNVHTPV